MRTNMRTRVKFRIFVLLKIGVACRFNAVQNQFKRREY